MGVQPASWDGLFERALACAQLLGQRAFPKLKLTLKSSGTHACEGASCQSGLNARYGAGVSTAGG